MIPHPHFPIIPDFTTAPRTGLIAETERVSLSAAESLALFPEATPTRIFTHRFKLTARAEIEALKAFFSGRAGRCHPFYLPSWRDDLTLVSATADTVTVTDPDVLPGHADSHTRTLFIWQEDDLHVSRWTTIATSGANWIYYLETPLTFTPTAGVAMVGFAHLARFADDRLLITHRMPAIAEAEIGFRAGRAWSGIETTHTMTPIPIGEHPGFTTGAITADDLLPIEQRIAYAIGPAVLRTPATPSTRWACWLGADGIPRLKTTVGTIVLPDATGTAAALFPAAIDAERLSLAFDHDGAEYIAWQDGATINLRWWAGVAMAEAWTGYDPVLAYDWFTDTGMSSALAAVMCFYRKTGDNRLYARTAAADFATETVAATLPAKPMEIRGIDQTEYTDLLIADANWRLLTLATA